MSEKANVDLMKGGSGSKACSLCMISLSLIFCALSGVASVWLPKFINDAIVDSGTICDASDENFKDYTTPENSLTENFYFYGWDQDDAIAFSRGLAKAKVTEMGPYTWNKKTYTYDVTFADGMMTYTDAAVYIYNEAESPGVSLDDPIIVESLGYQGILSVAQSEGLLNLSVAKCTPAQIKASNGVNAQAYLGWLGIDFTTTTLDARATLTTPAPNNVCRYLAPGGAQGNVGEPAIPTLVDEDCMCCIPGSLGDVYKKALAFVNVDAETNDVKAIAAASLTATFAGAPTPLTSLAQVAFSCNDLAASPTVNGLFDLLLVSDRALVQGDNVYLGAAVGQNYYKNRVTDPTGTGDNLGKFPITGTFHKITVKELAFGYASAFVGRIKVGGGIADGTDIANKLGVTTVTDVYATLNDPAKELYSVGQYNNAVYSACLFSQRCTTDKSRDFIYGATEAGAGPTLDINTFTDAATLNSLIADTSALKKSYLAYSKCDGELNFATASGYSGGLVSQANIPLDIEGISCKPASVGYAVANHYCGMREDFLAGTNPVKGDPAADPPTSPSGDPLADTNDGSGILPLSYRFTADCKCLGDTERLKYQFTFKTVYPEVAGCCLAYGNSVALGGSLAGFGCMVPIPGRITGARDSLVVAKAANTDPDNYSSKNTGCKAGEEENAWNQVTYQKKTEYAVYMKGLVDGDTITLTKESEVPAYPTVFPPVDTPLTVSQALIDDLKYLPSPYMMATLVIQAPAENKVNLAVEGGNGAQIPPQGLDTRSFGGAHLNDNVAVKDSFILFESNTKLGASVSNKGASVVKEIPTQRYELDADAFHGTGKAGVRTGTNADVGVGFPWEGIVPIGWDRGAPVAISQPNFLNGKNGGIYKTTNYVAGVAIDGVTIMPTVGTDALTQEIIDLDTDSYQTYFDVEISTGKTFQVHQRLQLNTYFGACHESQTDCGLIEFKTVPSAASTDITRQLPSIYNLRTPNMLGDVIVPLFRLDRNAIIKDDSADAFKGLEKMMQLADIGSIICLLFGVVLGLFGIVKCMQN